MNINKDNLFTLIKKEVKKGLCVNSGLWAKRGDTLKCDKTGLPLSKIFQSLFDAGFVISDIGKLERCGTNKEIVIANLIQWRNECIKECEAELTKQFAALRVRSF